MDKRFTIYSHKINVSAPTSLSDDEGLVICEEIDDLFEKAKDAIMNALNEKFPNIVFGISSD